jgi:hypothetical protein
MFLSGDIATDGQGTVYVTGDTHSPNFPIINGFQTTPGGITDGYVAAINTKVAGSGALVYSTFLGGQEIDQGYGIALTRDRNIYVTGLTGSTDFPLRGSIVELPSSMNWRIFVTKIDTSQVGDGSLVYSTLLGEGGDGQGGSTVDAQGATYITASLSEGTFPIIKGFQTEKRGDGTYSEAYMAKLSFRADLQISKVVEPIITIVGEPISMTISVRGMGPDVATAVRMTEFFPENVFTLEGVSSTQGECHYETNLVECELGSIAPDQVAQVIIRINAITPTDNPVSTAESLTERDGVGGLIEQADTGVQTTASVDGVEPDVNPTNNTISENIHVYTFDNFVPTLLSPVDGSTTYDTRPALQWKPVSGATRYEVQVARSNLDTAPVVQVSTNEYVPVTPLLTTTYAWRVRAVNAANVYTPWSVSSDVTIGADHSAAPILNLIQTSRPTLRWNRVSWAKAYVVQIAKDSTFRSLIVNKILDGNALEFTPNDPLPNGTYYWRVRGVENQSQLIAWSSTQRFILVVP